MAAWISVRRVLMIVLVAALGSCAGPNGGFGKPRGSLARGKGCDLPVSSVTLYAGGAAYIEHEGTVKDDAAIELQFKDGQLNGVLKSLIVRDASDAQPAVVVRPRNGNKSKTQNSVAFGDKTLDNDDSHADDEEQPKGPSIITVQIKGKGERQVTIGYTLDAQPWKTSYRLMLVDRPALQAWAKVVNETEYDWKDVRLSLLSGRPLVLADGATLDSSAVNKAAGGAGVTAGESLRRPRPSLRARPSTVTWILLATVIPSSLATAATSAAPTSAIRARPSAMTSARSPSRVVHRCRRRC